MGHWVVHAALCGVSGGRIRPGLTNPRGCFAVAIPCHNFRQATLFSPDSAG